MSQKNLNKEETKIQEFMERIFNKSLDQEYVAESMRMDLDEDSFAIEKSLLKLPK